MIQSNELRIGNWVNAIEYSYDFRVKPGSKKQKSSSYTQVSNIYDDGINLYIYWGGDQERIPFNSLEPIPLTEEILLKCGFIWAEDNVYGGFISPMLEDGSRLRIRHNSKGYFYTANEYIQPLYITSLHQLQNLFYALTNKELQITF